MFYALVISLPMLAMLSWLVFFSLQWLMPREHKRPDTRRVAMLQNRILALFYGAAFILYTCHWIYFSGIINPYVRMVYFMANLSVYPLFWFYLRRLAGKPIRSETWLLLPALLLPISKLIAHLAGWSQVETAVYLLVRICFALEVVYVIVRGQQLIYRFRQELDNFYGDERGYRLQPINRMLWLFAITACASIVLNLIGRERLTGNHSVIIAAAVMTCLLWSLGYIASQLEPIAEDMMSVRDSRQAEPTADKPQTAKDSTGSDNLSERFHRLMEERRPYLDSDLTLQDLATMLGTNRTYLSQLLHHEYQTNFSTYINRQRLALAKEKLASTRHSSGKQAIQEAIESSGFASESTFYRLFKQETGLSPMAWQQTLVSAENQLLQDNKA